MRQSTIYERVEEVHGIKAIRLKSGRQISFWQAFAAAERAESDLHRAISRCFKLLVHDWDLERLEWFINNLEDYIGALREEIKKRRSVQIEKERIALLRNTRGRTPEEADTFRRKADELEARLEEKV